MEECKIISVSEFFKEIIPPLILGAFFSRRMFSENGKYIYVYTAYKKSQKIDTDEIVFENYEKEYRDALNSESGNLKLWLLKSEVQEMFDMENRELNGQIFFILKNDMGIKEDSFYNKLYAKIVSTCDWLYDEKLNEDKKAFIRGFMELRGSIDTTANYIAQDYFYGSSFEIKKARLLVDYLSIPFNVVNINFRELQKDYYTGIRMRNTQLRFNIWWYMENVGIMNGYKAEVFAKSRDIDFPDPEGYVYYFYGDVSRRRANNNLLDERLNFYSTNVYSHDITEDDIKIMRSELNFDKTHYSVRSQALVEAIRYLTPDECVCCKDKYNIEDRSFINKNTGRYYFEIHHVISIGNNKELDDENNMVKLCPACHRALKRGSGKPEEQKQMIRDIFKNAPQTLEFAKNFYDEKDFEKIVDLTFNSLN